MNVFESSNPSKTETIQYDDNEENHAKNVLLCFLSQKFIVQVSWKDNKLVNWMRWIPSTFQF